MDKNASIPDRISSLQDSKDQPSDAAAGKKQPIEIKSAASVRVSSVTCS